MDERSVESPCALVTGINGQDGSYLAEFLLGRGYRVVGTVRSSNSDLSRILPIRHRLVLAELDLLDFAAIEALISKHRPTEVYNLAARASSTQLHSDPIATAEYNGLAVTMILEAIRQTKRPIRFCQASSSEMFGNSAVSPQDEQTALRPRNAYGVAKAFGHWTTINYREREGVFSCSAILFNHESPRRGREFLTRKVTYGAAMIRAGKESTVSLGDLEARRDWGFAGDYVHAMWLMLQAPKPADYVIATGQTHSVREVCEIAFHRVGLQYSDHVTGNSAERREEGSVQLVGKAERIRRELDWRPAVSFRNLIEMMVDADVERVSSTH